MKKKIIIVLIIVVIAIVLCTYFIYNLKESKNIKENTNTIGMEINGLYEENNDQNNSQQEELQEDAKRKTAYYDQDGFVTDNLYIDCQIYCNYENDNIKAIIDTKSAEIESKIMSESDNTSGMVVINLSANTQLHEKINVLQYDETYIRYKMLKTYFDETFSKEIMLENNKPENSNIFNADLENNKNIVYNVEETSSYYSVKTGQKIQNVADLFSSEYDYTSVIKERVKYMLDLDVGYTDSQISKKVNTVYDNLQIDIDLLNEKLKISLAEDGFEMFFDEFDKSQMTIY
jgi:flagellar basal body-associated protein FliL